MNRVCGQTQPHQSRPYAAVKIMMPVKKINNATASSAMSCGQKIRPRIEKRRVTILSISAGFPLIRMNGTANRIPSSAQLK